MTWCLAGRGSWPSPNPAVAGQHRGRRVRTPSARSIRFGLWAARPVILDRVKDFPRQLDFFMAWEQRRIAEQDVENQALVSFGTRLREGLPVGEVHVDVTYFHRRAWHL